MDKDSVPQFVTVPAAARRLGLGRDQIRGAIARGELRAVVVHADGWPRIAVAELVRWTRSLQPRTRTPDRDDDARGEE
jgi:hypothetical protein